LGRGSRPRSIRRAPAGHRFWSRREEQVLALALETGRAKDQARLLQFVEAGVLDAERFQAILSRHHVVDAWQKFERQFLSDTP
jgi:hypothetical protein